MAPPLWILVSGDFTTWGGMDRANYELAWHLAEKGGAETHLVCHFAAEPLASHPRVTMHRVAKPLNRYALAAPLLAWSGRRLAGRLAPRGARVVVNGGNCQWADINWVHYVHSAWMPRVEHASIWQQARFGWSARREIAAETSALRAARHVIVNSDLTHGHVLALGVAAERMQTVYYGIDPDEFRPVTVEERLTARRRLSWEVDRPTAVFVGSLGHDRRKGFDVLFEAWALLAKESAWDCDLVAVGGGSDVPHWQGRAEQLGLSQRIRMLGFSKQVPDVLAAADLLISPTYYEAYGLGVHEALCRGLPAMVTRSAGVAERYPSDLADLLLDAPPTVEDLAARLRRWRSDQAGYRQRVAPLAELLRARTWSDMSKDFLACVEATPVEAGR